MSYEEIAQRIREGGIPLKVIREYASEKDMPTLEVAYNFIEYSKRKTLEKLSRDIE